MKPQFSDTALRDLKHKLAQENVSSRQGAGGKSLSYLKAHVVRRELNRIFGHDGWSLYTLENKVISQQVFQKKGWQGKPPQAQLEILAQAHVKLVIHTESGFDVIKTGTGVGSGTQNLYPVEGSETKIPQGAHLAAYELALKEAESDAMKRAAMNLGDPLGLALYDPDQENVLPSDQIERADDEIDQKIVAKIEAATEEKQLYKIFNDIAAANRGMYKEMLGNRKKELSK